MDATQFDPGCRFPLPGIASSRGTVGNRVRARGQDSYIREKMSPKAIYRPARRSAVGPSTLGSRKMPGRSLKFPKSPQSPQSRLKSFRLVAIALIVLLVVIVVRFAARHDPTAGPDDRVADLDNAVFDHYRARGAVLHGRAGRACPDCLRGILATKDARVGEAVFELPRRLEHSLTGEFRDHTHELPGVRCSLLSSVSFRHLCCFSADSRSRHLPAEVGLQSGHRRVWQQLVQRDP